MPVAGWRGEAFRDAGLERALAAIGVPPATERTAGYWTSVGYGRPVADQDQLVGRIRFGLPGVDDQQADRPVAPPVLTAVLRGLGFAAACKGALVSVVGHFAWQGAARG